MRILILEHNHELNQRLTKNLAENGYLSDTAVHFKEVQFYFGSRYYDLILINENFPGCDAIDFVKTLTCIPLLQSMVALN